MHARCVHVCVRACTSACACVGVYEVQDVDLHGFDASLICCLKVRAIRTCMYTYVCMRACMKVVRCMVSIMWLHRRRNHVATPSP